MKLHTYGLLRNSFRPSGEIRQMRTYWRQRNDLVQAAGRHIQRMQKALTQMNIQLANVLSDISGKSGQAIIHAILKGQRDPYELAAMCDVRVKASEEEVAHALEGNWQEDLLFMLQQELDGYEFCQKQIAECDQRLYQYLQHRPDQSAGATLPKEHRKGRREKNKKNKAAVRPAQATILYDRDRSHANRRNRRPDSDDCHQRSGMGHEQVAH